METVNTETETTASGYEYTHADGTVQHVESAEKAIRVCPVLGKMAVEKANLLLELSALGQGIIDQQKEQQSESAQDSTAENQLIAPVVEAPKTTNQPESNIYSDSSGYRPVGAIKTEQPKPKIDTKDIVAPTELSPEPAPNNAAKTPSEVKPQNIPEKPLLKPESTDYKETTKIEQPVEETLEIIKISPVIENSLDSSYTEVAKDEPYVQDLIPIPLEVPVEEISNMVEDSREPIVEPVVQEIAPQEIDEVNDNKLDIDDIVEVPAPIIEPGVVSHLEDTTGVEIPEIEPTDEPSYDEVLDHTANEPIAEAIIEQITELAGEQINPEDILNTPVVTDIIETVQNLHEQIESGAETLEIEQTRAELTTKLVALFEELGIEIEPEEIEKLIIEITKNTPEATELTEYLPTDDIDLESSGTHEIKRSLSKFLSDSVDTAERDIKQFIGKIILRHITAKS